jgi:hypothetical protein
MKILILTLLLPMLLMASTSLDDEIINDLDFYQNLDLVQESKNTLDVNLESIGLAIEDQNSAKAIVEKGN